METSDQENEIMLEPAHNVGSELLKIYTEGKEQSERCEIEFKQESNTASFMLQSLVPTEIEGEKSTELVIVTIEKNYEHFEVAPDYLVLEPQQCATISVTLIGADDIEPEVVQESLLYIRALPTCPTETIDKKFLYDNKEKILA